VQNSGELRRGIVGIHVQESTRLAHGDRGEDWQESPRKQVMNQRTVAADEFTNAARVERESLRLYGT
jgi:hypothetical protein